MTPQVAIAVVSWNTRDLLLRCLDALAADVSSGLAELSVVDNGSSDDSVAAARRAAPWARIIESGENLGFGPAVNRIARSTACPWIVCANADVAPEPGALELMLMAAEADRRIAAVAPMLVLPDGTPQHSVHSLPTLRFTLALNLGIDRVSARAAERLLLGGRYDAERARTVGWAIGAFLLLRREVFLAVGSFDERQWMYAEDLDLGWRLRDAGLRTLYLPQARVRHESAASTQQAFGGGSAARFMRATYAVIARRRGVGWAWLTAILNLAGVGVRLTWLAIRPGADAASRARSHELRGWLAAHRAGLTTPRRLRSFR